MKNMVFKVIFPQHVTHVMGFLNAFSSHLYLFLSCFCLVRWQTHFSLSVFISHPSPALWSEHIFTNLCAQRCPPPLHMPSDVVKQKETNRKKRQTCLGFEWTLLYCSYSLLDSFLTNEQMGRWTSFRPAVWSASVKHSWALLWCLYYGGQGGKGSSDVARVVFGNVPSSCFTRVWFMVHVSSSAIFIF